MNFRNFLRRQKAGDKYDHGAELRGLRDLALISGGGLIAQRQKWIDAFEAAGIDPPRAVANAAPDALLTFTDNALSNYLK